MACKAEESHHLVGVLERTRIVCAAPQLWFPARGCIQRGPLTGNHDPLLMSRPSGSSTSCRDRGGRWAKRTPRRVVGLLVCVPCIGVFIIRPLSRMNINILR